MEMLKLSVVAVFFVLIQLSTAEEVQFSSCPPISSEADISRNCTVHHVRLSPCPEAAHNRPCSIKRRQLASIEFDYTPEKTPTALESMAYWSTEMDIPFGEMDHDACLLTNCQGSANQEQTYTFNLTIPNKARPRQYDIKWKLWNANMECCFKVTFVVPSKRN